MTQTPEINPINSSCERFAPIAIRLLVWGGVFGVLWVLSSFFLLIFLTFVFGYIQSRGEKRLERLIPTRPMRVILVATIFLGILVAVGVFLVPRAKEQTILFVMQLPQHIERVDQEIIDLTAKYPMLRNLVPGIEHKAAATDAGLPRLASSPLMALVQQVFSGGETADGMHKMTQVVDLVRGIGGSLAAIASAFLLALLFSFLIVLDLPRLSASVRSLKHSRLDFVYQEVAGSILDFGTVLGKSLEAQFTIAAANSILTAIGIAMLGLGKQMAFLSVIVFVCSFIPVLGVFISSVPICLIALQASGLMTMLLAVVMITIIHIIEGYILNPRIYGTYMRINPVIVLCILTIGAKLFQVWGLVLGVPICTYIYGQIIRKDPPEIQGSTMSAHIDQPDFEGR